LRSNTKYYILKYIYYASWHQPTSSMTTIVGTYFGKISTCEKSKQYFG